MNTTSDQNPRQGRGKLVAAGLLICIISALWATRTSGRQRATVYTTSADSALRLQVTKTKVNKDASAGATLTIAPETSYQEVDGFGYAITYSTAYNLLQMEAAARHDFLVKAFSPTEGYGCSYVRISIGCSDFSSTEYTLCDEPGLENFRLHSDEVDYVIPVLKEILAINPDLKIIGSPWTCPKWMKAKDLAGKGKGGREDEALQPYDSWTGGRLNPNYREEYAQYFVKFVQAFESNGIGIYAVTPQNEPLHSGNCASLYMPWDEEAAFIAALAPAFARAGLKTKIYAFDHNFNYDDKQDQVDYPVQVFGALDAGMEGFDLVAGSAWHNYGGSPAELDDIHAKMPDKEMIFTESSIGTWNNGRDLGKRLLADVDGLLLACVNRHCRAVIVWNMMLDLQRGPNLDGGCTTCYGAVDIDQADYSTIHYNSHFYMVSHVSVVTRPGAVRVASSLAQVKGADEVTHAAFCNPDGSYGLVLCNKGKTDLELDVDCPAMGYVPVTLPARSVVSVLIPASNN